MRVLILGGAGFLGANLAVRCAQEAGVQVTVLDSLDGHFRSSVTSLKAVWERIRFVRADIRDEVVVSSVVQDQDIIINCAAQTSHPLSTQFPLLDADINCLGNLRVLEAVRLLNPKAHVVYVSSTTVIGKAILPVVDEDHPERPLEIYSANKAVAEKYHHIFHSMHDLRTTVLRLPNLFGPRGKPFPEFGFINYFADVAWHNGVITLFGNGGQRRSVLYVKDAVEVIWAAANTEVLVGQTHLAVGDENPSVSDIAHALVKTFARGRIEEVPWPENRRRMEVDSVTFSDARLRSKLAWRPRFTLQAGLEDFREHLLALEAP